MSLSRIMIARLLRRARQWIGRHLASPKERRHALVGPARLWKMKRDFQIDFLKRSGLWADHTVLDLGCGTLRGGVPIIEYLEPGHYCGVEVRREALDQGKKELEETGLVDKTPTLVWAEDLRGVDLGRRFDYIWAFSVFIHMPDAVLESSLDMVARHLADDGTCYANVNVGPAHDGKWLDFPVVRRTAAFYQAAVRRQGLALEPAGTLRSLGHITNSKQDDQIMLRIRKGVTESRA